MICLYLYKYLLLWDILANEDFTVTDDLISQLFVITFVHPVYVSGVVHTGVEVRRIDSEMSELVEWPWLQLMCCAVCLPRGRNFRWWGEVWDGSECWLVCRHWTPEIEFNKRLSSSIIRLVNYSVTTSLIYKLIV